MLGATECVALICAIFVVVRYAVVRFPATPREEAHWKMVVPCLLALLATRGHVLRALAVSLLVGFSAQRFGLLDKARWVSGTVLAFGDWMVPYVAIYVAMLLLG